MCLAHLASPQRTRRFHQHHAAGLGEAGLAAAALAVHQFQQFFAQHFIAEQVGQSNDGLLHRADALHHIGPLAHQLAQLLVRRPHHFLYMRIGAAGKISVSRAVAAVSPVSMT